MKQVGPGGTRNSEKRQFGMFLAAQPTNMARGKTRRLIKLGNPSIKRCINIPVGCIVIVFGRPFISGPDELNSSYHDLPIFVANPAIRCCDNSHKCCLHPEASSITCGPVFAHCWKWNPDWLPGNRTICLVVFGEYPSLFLHFPRCSLECLIFRQWNSHFCQWTPFFAPHWKPLRPLHHHLSRLPAGIQPQACSPAEKCVKFTKESSLRFLSNKFGSQPQRNLPIEPTISIVI